MRANYADTVATQGLGQAVQACLDLGLPDKAALAASFWAREEIRAKTPSAVEILNTAARLAGQAPSSDAELVLARISEELSYTGGSGLVAVKNEGPPGHHCRP